MRLVFIVVMSTMLFISTAYCQNSNKRSGVKLDKEEFIEVFEKFHQQNVQEKIYISFDKPSYFLGDDIWFNVFLLSGIDHSEDTLSSIVYIELVDSENKILATKPIKIINNVGKGDFTSKEVLIPGIYTIRAYTNFMRNYDHDYFFHKKIEISNPISNHTDEKTLVLDSGAEKKDLKNLSFQMFPEGGTMVEGITTVIAFMAKNQFGKGIEVEGNVYDQSEKLICSFKSNKLGVGAFNFKPEKGKEYYALISKSDNSYRYPLPIASKSGYVMNITNSTEDNLTIHLSSNISHGLSGVMLIGHIRGNIVYSFDDFQSTFNTEIEIDKRMFPDGVMHLTLFDYYLNPLSERLAFVQNKYNQVNVTLSQEKENYNINQKVIMNVGLEEEEGELLNGRFSVSIFKNKKKLRYNSSGNFKSFLLLTSDLKKEVENPDYYFDDINTKTITELDHLMICQQWRRFHWEDILTKQRKKLHFLPEKGFNISGRVINNDEERTSATGTVTLVSTNPNIPSQEIQTTNDGKFNFSGYDFVEPTKLLIQVINKNERKKQNNLESSLAIELDQFQNPPLSKKILNIQDFNYGDTLSKENMLKKDPADDLIFENKTIILEELTVEGTQKKKDPFFSLNKGYTQKPDYRVVMDSLPSSIKERDVYSLLASLVPGLEVWQTAVGYYILFKGKNTLWSRIQPLVTIDNISYSINDLGAINPLDIHHVDIINRPTIYGGDGAGGLIAVYTKRSYNKSSGIARSSVINFNSQSYYKPRNFDSLKQSDGLKSDVGYSTIYWNPNFIIEDEDLSELIFNTGNNSGEIKIVIEGITEDGSPFFLEKVLTVADKD